MRDYKQDDQIVSEIAIVRTALPEWVASAASLVELAENAERMAVPSNPETLTRSKALIVEIADWQQKLGAWQRLDLSPRLKAELRILKATLDASMDEANTAGGKLTLFD
jgi:hypothetical protein